jgi:hypothetical protein
MISFPHTPLLSLQARLGLVALLALAGGLCPLRAGAQDTTKVRREQIQSLLDDFHLGRVTRVVEGLGVERLDEKEMALRKKFLGERLSVGFQKPFPIDRQEERWEVDYRLKGDLLLRGELTRQGASEQGAVDLLFRHEY